MVLGSMWPRLLQIQAHRHAAFPPSVTHQAAQIRHTQSADFVHANQYGATDRAPPLAYLVDQTA